MIEENVSESGPSVFNHNQIHERILLLKDTQRNMAEKIVGYSQETLVSKTEQTIKAKRFFQYVASFSASIGAIAAGMSVAWTSQAGINGANIAKIYNISITAEEFSWIGSLAALGSAISCVPIGTLTDIIGRKYAMLILVIPFTIGWLCIIFANSVILFYIGRFLTGFSGGAFCVTIPMYTSEIAETLLSVCSYIVPFALGFGPIPWMMIAELFSPETKAIASSSACLLNWIVAFIVTKTFVNLNDTIHIYGTFWLFSLVCAIGFGFVLFVVPETKGKTLEQIQHELSA